MRKRNTFRPTDIGGCVLWLDGADPAGTGVAPANGSTVSTWVDKSGSGNSGTATGGTITVTNNILSFSGTPYFTTPYTARATTETIFIVYTMNPSLITDSIVIGSTSSSGRNIGTYQGVLWPQIVGVGVWNTGYTITNGPTYLHSFTRGSFGLNFFNNGSPFFSSATVYNPSGSSTTNIGQSYYGILVGTISEIIIYTTTPSTPQRQQVEAYLSQKWGLRQQIPQSHPGTTAIVYSQQSIPKAIYWRYQYTFTPTSIGGCQIWMDAADITSFTFSSGSNISLWKDKSGYSNNFTTVSGTNTRIADGGYSVVSFPSGAVMSSANQVNLTTTSALFIVCKVLDTGFDMILACTNITSGSFLGDFSIRTISGVLSYGNADDIGNQNYYVNGTFNPSFGSSTYVNTYSIIDTLVSGKSGTTYLTFSSSFFSRFFIGNIAEFIFYPGGVSNPDRQQIEGYLAWKWGLQGSLDSSNPYKNSSPSTTNPAGISRPAGLPVRSIACYPTPLPIGITGANSSNIVNGYYFYYFTSPTATAIINVPGKNITVFALGGGGGGGYFVGGGGGAGGLQTLTSALNGSYTVTVGNGGAGSTGPNSTGPPGSNGSNTTFVGGAVSITALGGGGGGTTFNVAGANGGCGGGAPYGNSSYGTGSQGYNGQPAPAGGLSGGGGGIGGAGGHGGLNKDGGYGYGGTAISTYLDGNQYGGGGGAGNNNPGNETGGFATSGGGAGALDSVLYGDVPSSYAKSGTANKGAGGGGGGNGSTALNTGGAGGSGIVILSYVYP